MISSVGEMKSRANNHSCPARAEASDSAADSSMRVDEAADVLSRPEAPDEEMEGVELSSSSTQQTVAIPLTHSEPSEPASSSSPARQPSTEDRDEDTTVPDACCDVLDLL